MSVGSEEFLSNFIPISRKIFRHELWDEKRVFSRFEAWMDILQTARYESEERTDWISNRQITYGRGEFPASVRFLQKRWNWGSITRVERFLKMLENKDMVVLKKGQSQIVISVCKYDDYNPLKKPERTVKGHQQGQQKDKSNKVIKKIYSDIVLLSDIEYERLTNEFGKELVDEAIKYLSDWGKEKPSKFKSSGDHNLTIRRWVIDAVLEKRSKKPKQPIVDQF